jgi:transcriptional regulator with XRE-family HTH domain
LGKREEEAMDLVLKLREIRKLRGLSQKDVARLSGVGEKTISSFETGQRIGSLKLAQLKRMLGVYGLTRRTPRIASSRNFASCLARCRRRWSRSSS